MNSALKTLKPSLSLVIPCYNEAAGLPVLYERISAVIARVSYPAEILFIDDGSTDDTGDVIDSLARTDPRVGKIALSRNFGKEAALSAGIDHARGDAVIFLDADLQDPPECIPQMLRAWRHGYDSVAMKRARRDGDSLLKRNLARSFYAVLSSLSDVQIPNDVGDFRLLSRRAVDAVKAMPERNRYTKGLFAWVGFSSIELEFDRPPRLTGRSKWPFVKLLALAFDGISSFSIAPLRLASLAGAFTALFAMAYGAFIVIKTAFVGETVAGFPTMFVMISFLGGVQLMAIGLLGEYVGRLLIESKQRPIYFTSAVRLPSPEHASESPMHEVGTTDL